MWRELNLICRQMKLFEQFAGVTMTKDGVGGEIVGGMHEVRLCRCGFSGSAHTGLRIADDSVFNVDEASLKQRREREDDRGRVASGVGNQTGVPDLVAMQFRTSVDRFRLQLGGEFRVGILQPVDVTVDVVLQSPGAAQVNDFDAVLDRLRDPFTRLFMRCGQK